jgi:tRNA(Ile)-lysidine synthase
MLDNFIDKLTSLVGSNYTSKKYIVALSGGADSMVLAYLCKQADLNVILAHCNFNLRGKESDGDADFVLTNAKNWNIPCEIKSFDTPAYAEQNKVGTQVAARELRYAWFEELRQQHQADYVFVAHHKNDQVETFFINLLRGAGLNGLTGIKEVNNAIIRPLLSESKEQILRYAQLNKIDFREDSSNASDKYMRNQIRHELVPLLENIKPGSVNKIEEEIGFLNQAKEELNHWSLVLKKACWIEEGAQTIINKLELKKIKNPIYYLIDWLSSFGFNASQLSDIWITDQSGSAVLSETHQILNDREKLIISRLKKQHVARQVITSIPYLSDSLKVNEITKEQVQFDLENKSVCVAMDKLQFPLTYRLWKQGDAMCPLGMKGKKKLVSDILIDAKIDGITKASVMLLADANHEIIWLSNHCVSETVKINNSTKKIVLMEIV